MRYFVFYKPYGYLSQFSNEDGNPGLGQILEVPKDVYPVGRLDKDSEGLLLLTNNKTLNFKLLNPNQKHSRTYWVQVDREIDSQAIERLKTGVSIKVGKKKYTTLPCEVKQISQPTSLPERIPPVRFRKKVPTSWIEMKLVEGKNRQVRKMCAAVGFPCLRLIRMEIENLTLEGLKPGEIMELDSERVLKLLKIKK